MSDQTQDPAPAGGEANPDNSGGGASDHESSTDNALAAQLRKAQKQLKQAEKRIASFEEMQAQKQEAELSEIERYKKQAEEAQAALEQEKQKASQFRLRSAFDLAAKDAGIIDPDAAFKLADLSMVELNEDGSVNGIKEAFKDLQKTRAYLFGSAPNGNGASSGANPSNGAPTISPKKIESMSPAEWKEFSAKVAAGEIKL